MPRGGDPRQYVRALADSRHQARRRRAPLDPAGALALALAGDAIHAMDVGAAGGVAPHWREYLPVMEVDCFEPDATECAARQREAPPNVRWFPVALAGTTGRRKFYVLNRPTGSSLLPPNDPVILEYSGQAYAGVRKVIDVDCLSLADFLAEHQRPTPVLMKLDTQGTELEILSSLSAAQLDGLALVEMEVEFLQLYEDQPTFGDVHAFMQGQGFRLLDLRTHRSYRNADDQPYHFLRKYLDTGAGSSALSAELVAGDALYIRESRLQAAPATLSELATTLCVLRLYGFYDLAFWLVEKAARDGTLSAVQSRDLAADIAHGAPRPNPAQRAGIAGSVTRRMLWALGYDDHEVFWTRRKWPNQ
jgi:FkbM family methyltransferase